MKNKHWKTSWENKTVSESDRESVLKLKCVQERWGGWQMWNVSGMSVREMRFLLHYIFVFQQIRVTISPPKPDSTAHWT